MIDAQELKKHIPIEPFYREALGEPSAKTAASSIFFCPFHNDRKTPKQGGRLTGEYQTEVIDHGVSDKRAMVWESEFAMTLQVLKRESNTLSAVIRQAWDGGLLKTMTKTSPAKSTDPHISIIGHITKDELKSLLCSNEYSNGFANRILWVCTRRANILPEGGRLHEVNLNPLIERLSKAVSFVKGAGELKRDDEARDIWRAVYPALSDGKPGLVEKVTARAEPHVMRLACLYALMDMSTVVKAVHLTAALAVWTYCEKSAEYIFGDSMGDRVADGIMQELKNNPDGMTRTEISSLFGRNIERGRIDEALKILVSAGFVKCETEKSGGRNIERWQAVRN